jgi:peptidyl-prolyl cis-trans isomerase C
LKFKIFIFFLIGLFIYIIDIGFNSDQNSKDIFISDQEITSLISAWKSQVGRSPTDDEIGRIITNLIEEEILYREALLLGLDKEDRIIKRRLAQKISFLKQESLVDKPSNNDLIGFYNANKDKYYIQPTFTFKHYFFSAESNSGERSQAAYKKILNNDQDIKSDPFFLGKSFSESSLDEISGNFGRQFSLNFNEVILNKWLGPFKSSFGDHIIFIMDARAGYYPPIAQVLGKVEVDLVAYEKEEAVSNYINKIKSEYKVIINPNLKFDE